MVLICDDRRFSLLAEILKLTIHGKGSRVWSFVSCSGDRLFSIQIPFEGEKKTQGMYLVVVFGVTWVEREVMEPLQEEGREG